jgi:hypothetical protein
MALAKLSKTQKNFDFKSQKNKVMLITFFDSQEIIHIEFVPPGQTMNKEYCDDACKLE